jgi:hypothetical protein
VRSLRLNIKYKTFTITQEIINDFKQDCSKNRIPKNFLLKYNMKKFCEVGVWRGSNSEKMMEAKPDTLICVDIWKNEKCYLQAKNKLDKYKEIKLIKKYSVEASMSFVDNFFDYIYIDSAHDYISVKNDINAWWPKIKIGGIFGFHDYCLGATRYDKLEYGVIRTVNEFVEKNNISITQIKKEKHPSFFILKDKI